MEKQWGQVHTGKSTALFTFVGVYLIDSLEIQSGLSPFEAKRLVEEYREKNEHIF